MFDRILRRLRRLIQEQDYVISVHARDEAVEDRLSAEDVETCILTGSIVERQLDRKAGEWKYVVRGRSTADVECVVVVKLTGTGRVAILTVLALDG